MADLPVQSTPRAGLVPVYSDASGSGDTFTNTGRQVILLKNVDSSNPKTVKFIVQAVVDTLLVPDLSVSVPPNSTMLVGRFSPSVYNNTAGKIEVEAPDPWQLGLAVIEPTPAHT